MAIENEDILALKRSVSLADVVRGRGVELKRKGRQLWGLCPFHEDTEPSFAVDELDLLELSLPLRGRAGFAFGGVRLAAEEFGERPFQRGGGPLDEIGRGVGGGRSRRKSGSGTRFSNEYRGIACPPAHPAPSTRTAGRTRTAR